MIRCIGPEVRDGGGELPSSFEAFRQEALAAGCDEALVREWDPGIVVGTHSHPFDAEAIVVQGEMWLTEGSRTRHLTPGGTFRLAAGTPHAERYGTEGATYWVGRTNVADGA